ncbi:MAG TPA: hypothetical protein VF771_18820 [Longimicrobiaceae bacterium]
MKKLRLDAEALRVESFASAFTPPLRATIHAHAAADESWESTDYGSCCGTCADLTCAPNCPGSDWESCVTCDGPTCRAVDCP